MNRESLLIVIDAIEAVIWNRSIQCNINVFFSCWEQLSQSARNKVYTLYYPTLRDCYYNRTSVGQTVIRTVGAL